MRLAAAALALILALPAQAASFSDWLQTDVWPEARAAGVSRATFERATVGLTPDTSIPNLRGAASKTQRQSEFRPPARYFREKSLASLARRGAALSRKHRRTLRAIEDRYGVPGNILLAIWARETGYGAAKLPKDGLRVLATLGHAGRRPDLFRGELVAALRMIENGVGRSALKSSWAGALGQPQFLPSAYLKYAVDFDGDGTADIWDSVPDTLASIANYLAKHGWVRGRDWGFEAVVPSSVTCALGGPDENRTVADWAAMGVKRVKGRRFPAHELTGRGYLLFPAGRYGPAFVTTPNFYVLKTYNESDAYALFVGHLADRIGGGGAFVGRWRPIEGFNRQEVQRMQERLVTMGHDVGGADGLVGYKTRASIGQWQVANGRDATCFPTREIVRALR